MASEPWESPESISPTGPSSSWGRPLRRNASVLELSGGSTCGGCAHCTPSSWRYGSCASLEPSWQPAWPPPPVCCVPHGPHLPHMHPHAHLHSPHTPQPYRRGKRTVYFSTGKNPKCVFFTDHIILSLYFRGESRGISRCISDRFTSGIASHERPIPHFATHQASDTLTATVAV